MNHENRNVGVTQVFAKICQPCIDTVQGAFWRSGNRDVPRSNSRGPVSMPPVSSTEHIPLPVPANEQTLELTYGFSLRPGVLLQPSLRYIVHPKGSASIPNALPAGATVPNALALGVNTVITF